MVQSNNRNVLVSKNRVMNFPGGSEIKNLPANAGDAGSIPGLGRFPWRRKWHPIPGFLPGESHGQKSLEGYSLWGCKESDVNERSPRLGSYLRNTRIRGKKYLSFVCCQSPSVFRYSLRAKSLRSTLPMGILQQEYWSGLPCPPPADLPDLGVKPASFKSNLNWQVGSSPLVPPGQSVL